LPNCNADNFQIFFDEFAKEYSNTYNIIVLDNGAFHKAKSLKIPANIGLIFLPPYSPELNPAENIWAQYKRAFSNLFCETLENVSEFITKFTASLSKEKILKTSAFSYIFQKQCGLNNIYNWYGFKNFGLQAVRLNGASASKTVIKGCEFVCDLAAQGALNLPQLNGVGGQNPDWRPNASFPFPERSKYGIYCVDCRALNIGTPSNLNDGNKFTNLVNGVFFSFNSGFFSGGSIEYNLTANTFTNITNQYTTGNALLSESQRINSVTNSINNQRGTAIFIDQLAVATPPQLSLVVDGKKSMILKDFDNVDKGIISRGPKVKIRDNFFNNVLSCADVRLSQANTNEDVNPITYNIMHNVFKGVTAMERSTRQLFIGGNTITTRNYGYQTVVVPITRQFPVAIECVPSGAIPNFTLKHNYLVDGNNINITSPKGVGIKISSTGTGTLASSDLTSAKNHINFSHVVPQTGMVQGWVTTNPPVGLLGYYVDGTVNCLFESNTVNGNYTQFPTTPFVNLQQLSAGYLFKNNAKLKITCNNATQTRFGFYGLGANSGGNATSILTNNCNANAYPWYFKNNGTTHGTFGNVGDPTNDCGNEFLTGGTGPAINYRIGNRNVYREGTGTMGAPNDIIFTKSSLCLPNQSTSSNGGIFPYNIININVPIIDGCNNVDLSQLMSKIGPNNYPYLTDLALTAINNNYLNHQVEKWMAEQVLYGELSKDAAWLNSNIELQNWHASMGETTIGQFEQVAAMIAQAQAGNLEKAESLNILETAKIVNGRIEAIEVWEVNYKDMLNLYLNALLNESQELNEEQMNTITILADACPFELGSAVYLARGIYTEKIHSGKMWSDDYACFAISNRGSNMTYADFVAQQDSMIQAELMRESILGNMQVHDVKVYPNPAKDVVNIAFNSPNAKSEFILLSTDGKVVHTQKIPAGNDFITISLPNTLSGLYFYKVNFVDGTTTGGKLQINK
jgi:hypothetical protein